MLPPSSTIGQPYAWCRWTARQSRLQVQLRGCAGCTACHLCFGAWRQQRCVRGGRVVERGPPHGGMIRAGQSIGHLEHFLGDFYSLPARTELRFCTTTGGNKKSAYSDSSHCLRPATACHHLSTSCASTATVLPPSSLNDNSPL